MDAENLEAIEKGYWMGLTVTRGSAPLRCYIGQVNCIDEHGIRLRPLDFHTDKEAEHDLFVSWKNLQVSLIATPESNIDDFLKSAKRWQNEMNFTAKDN